MHLQSSHKLLLELVWLSSWALLTIYSSSCNDPERWVKIKILTLLNNSSEFADSVMYKQEQGTMQLPTAENIFIHIFQSFNITSL